MFSLKICFGSQPGEPKVLRMKTTLVNCTNERQSIASEKVIHFLFLKSIVQLPNKTRFVWRKVNTLETLGPQSPVFLYVCKVGV